jgi:hypothetical protein
MNLGYLFFFVAAQKWSLLAVKTRGSIPIRDPAGKFYIPINSKKQTNIRPSPPNPQ